MKLDNQRNIYRIWLRKMVFTILFTAAVIVVMFVVPFEEDGEGLNKYHLIIAISVVFIILSVIGIYRNPYYFYFDDRHDTLVFRYYPSALFNSRKNSVQIPKQNFVKYETQKFFMGREEKLILHQHFRNKVAKYPPISLSAVDKEDVVKLKKALDHYSQEK